MCTVQQQEPLLLGLLDSRVEEKIDWNVNRVGGRPIWLSPTPLPVCPKCKTSMILVCELYCPLGNSPQHRLLYLFACTHKTCWNKQHAWTALRAQLKDHTWVSTDVCNPVSDCQVSDLAAVATDTGCHDDWGVDTDWGDDVTTDTVAMVTEKLENIGLEVERKEDKDNVLKEKSEMETFPREEVCNGIGLEENILEMSNNPSVDESELNEVDKDKEIDAVIPEDNLFTPQNTMQYLSGADTLNNEISQKCGASGQCSNVVNSENHQTNAVKHGFNSADVVSIETNKKSPGNQKERHNADVMNNQTDLTSTENEICVGDVINSQVNLTCTQNQSCLVDTMSESGLTCAKKESPNDNVNNSQINLTSAENQSCVVDTNDKSPVISCWYLNVFEEPEVMGPSLAHEERLLREYSEREGVSVRELIQDRPSASSRGSERYEKSEVKHGDRTFHKFLKRVATCPQQVLRYQYNGSPLFISSPEHLDKVPCCEVCGRERVFEFQLMPALVPYMKAEHGSGVLLEFGAVYIYTCAASCWTEGRSVQREYVCVQPDPDSKFFKV